jgi:hypothetical protein
MYGSLLSSEIVSLESGQERQALSGVPARGGGSSVFARAAKCKRRTSIHISIDFSKLEQSSLTTAHLEIDEL